MFYLRTGLFAPFFDVMKKIGGLILFSLPLLWQCQRQGPSLYCNMRYKCYSNISLRYNRYSNSALGSRTSSFTKLGGKACHSRRYFSFTSFLFSNSTLSSSSVVPVKVYSNADTCRLEILTLASAMQSRAEEENKGRAGIYRFTNVLNGKTYVGSSVDLRDRFLQGGGGAPTSRCATPAL